MNDELPSIKIDPASSIRPAIPSIFTIFVMGIIIGSFITGIVLHISHLETVRAVCKSEGKLKYYQKRERCSTLEEDEAILALIKARVKHRMVQQKAATADESTSSE